MAVLTPLSEPVVLPGTRTIRDLITGSLRLLNVIQAGQAPSSSDIAIGLEALSAMLDSWSTDKLLTFGTKHWYLYVTASKQHYTIGADGDWVIPRPNRIEFASFTPDAIISSGTYTPLANSIDYPVYILTPSEHAEIKMKGLVGPWPQALFDDRDVPEARITLYPVPSKSGVLTLTLWQPFDATTDLDLVLPFPSGYERAIRFGLAIELAAEFGKDIPDHVQQTAISTLGKIKRLNSRPQVLEQRTCGYSNQLMYGITGGFL